MLYFIKINLIVLFFTCTLISKTFGAEQENNLNFSFDDFTVINGEQEQPKQKPAAVKAEPELIETDKESGKSYLDEFFDKSLQTFEDLKKTGSKLINDLNKPRDATSVKTTTEDRAKNLPDPLFYDAIYNQNNKFITYAYVYNDKSNKDNAYIPKVYNYKIEAELLKLAKSTNERSKFYELFNTSREDKTFNINFTDQFGNTMLLTAMRNKNFEIFYFLLTQHANPDICNKANICAIHIAIHAFNFNLVKAICDVEGEIRMKDLNGVSPIEFAIFNDLEDIFDILLKRYLKYPINKQERLAMLEFANNAQAVKYYKKMRRAFNFV